MSEQPHTPPVGAQDPEQEATPLVDRIQHEVAAEAAVERQSALPQDLIEPLPDPAPAPPDDLPDPLAAALFAGNGLGDETRPAETTLSETRPAAAPDFDPEPADPHVPPAPLDEPDFARQPAAPIESSPIPAPVPPPVMVPPPAVPAAAMPSPQDAQPFGAGVCARCGSHDFGSGQVIAYSSKFRPAYFKPARRSFFSLHNLLRPFRAVVELEAQVCRSCGLVMLQVDVDQLTKVEKRAGQRD
jgi:hypothetical protein